MCPSSPDFLDRVGHRRRGDHGVGAGLRELDERSAEQLGIGERAGRIVDDDRISVARGVERKPDRLRAHRPAGHRNGSGRRGIERLRRQRHHDPLDRVDRAEGIDAPFEHRPPRKCDERLGPAGPKALATSRGHDQRDRHRVCAVDLLRGHGDFAVAV